MRAGQHHFFSQHVEVGVVPEEEVGPVLVPQRTDLGNRGGLPAPQWLQSAQVKEPDPIAGRGEQVLVAAGSVHFVEELVVT